MPVLKPIMSLPQMQQSQHSNEIIHVVLRALSSIDNRLIAHGERVAYLAQQIVRAGPPLDVDEKLLFILCILHDIGAYKTEEIDNLVAFETSDVQRHAAYGYLFLKHLTRLSDQAEAILHHHTDYRYLPPLGASNALYAQLIHLADRVDILLCTGQDPLLVRNFSGTRFHPALVERLLLAAQDGALTACLQSGAYREDLDRQISSMEFSSDEILDCLNLLVYAMDFRSTSTVAHTANVTAISTRLGQLLGLSEQTRQKLYFGAAFHDIGKISTPVEILEKTGRLTDEEMVIMRTHVVQSESILRGVVDDEICDIAVRHHEKLNGTGYPLGLTAADLSLPQRILAVADVMSALSGKRSYKERFSKRTTLDILHAMCARGELCPTVCAVTDANYDSIIADAQKVEQQMSALYTTIRSQLDDTIFTLSQASKPPKP